MIEKNARGNTVPEHIAIIMDGNGRWAKQQGLLSRINGHKNAITAVREATEICAEIGVSYLTLYAFSTENWSRPKLEVDALMQLLVTTIKGEMPTLNKNNVKLTAIGDLENLPDRCQEQLAEAIAETSENTGLTLNLALSYSGRSEIVGATKRIAQQVLDGSLSVEDIDGKCISSFLQTKDIPDPELLIRTSGEMRISNFLLWQIAYTELYFIDILWPDFRKKHILEAVKEYSSRERRFGKTSEQL